MAEENRDIIHMTLKDGKVVIETRPDLAPKHVAQIKQLINEGQYETKVLNDVWTAVTNDKKLSAQFEHTVGITDNGYEIFTTSNKGLDYPPYKI